MTGTPTKGSPGYIPDDAPIPLLSTYGKVTELLQWLDHVGLDEDEGSEGGNADIIAVEFRDALRMMLDSLHEAVKEQDINADINSINQQ